jgi:acyl-CoA synthetase (AMP-forming)/AMP-acid ligase II
MIEMLEAIRQESSSHTGLTFLNGAQAEHLSFEDLFQRAANYASTLQQDGLQPGDRVLLALPTSAELAIAFVGVMLAGGVPCVLPSFESTRSQTDLLQHAARVGEQLEARLLVGDPEYVQPPFGSELPFRIIAFLNPPMTSVHHFSPVAVTGDDLALIQASSGTTGRPKCVMLSHANLVANLAQIGERFQIGADDVIVCWLPLFHDMGLIGCFLLSLYWRMHGVFMTPYRFLRRPVAWLKAISDYRGTISPAPNFAYRLAMQRASAQELEGLNLSSWRAAVCGAEQIDVQVLQSFADHFAPYGLQRNSLATCYGLAEASVCVSMHPPGTPMRYERISRAQLATEHIATDTPAADALQIAACGLPVSGMRLRIVNHTGAELPDGCVGDLWIQGPSITSGYYRLPDETSAVLRDGWLDTGDQAYLRDGHLFITGRRKEVIIIRGQNYQPTDFEQAAAELPEVTPGRVIAFGVYDQHEATEQLVLLYEQRSRADDYELRERIQRHVALRTGIMPARVVMVARNSIPKTTSGKLQRARAKQTFLEMQHGE